MPDEGEGGEGGAKPSESDDETEAPVHVAWLKEECPWPADGRAAVSLTYDDAMPSQLQKAAPALQAFGIRGTFFITTVNDDAPWKQLLADGHELAGHTQKHPCPSAYGTPAEPLETYTLESFAAELDEDVAQLERLGAPKPYSFAYPCGVSWVGEDKESYVPLIEERFSFARLAGPGTTKADVELFGVPAQFSLETAEELTGRVDTIVEKGEWLVLGFHGVGGDWLVTEEEAHRALLKNLAERSDVWVAPFGEVAACVKSHQE